MSNWRGTYSGSTAYAAGDSVSSAGAQYYCVTANTGQTPGTGSDWVLADSFTGAAGGTAIDGVTVSGVPSAGQSITALTASTANWQTPAAGVTLDSTAGDIAALGSQAAGATGKAADAGHVHPATGVVLTSSLPLSLANGGTGQAGQQAAVNALTGTQSAGKVLRSDGTNATLSAIQAADVPTLNQSTSGTAAGLSATLVIASGGTGQTGAGAAFNALSPLTTAGDTLYGGTSGAGTRLAGPTAATREFYTSTGTGSAAQAPAWGAIAAGDLPAGTTSAQGALQLDGTAGDIKALGAPGSAAVAGATGKAADAGHVHPTNLLAVNQYAPASLATYTTTSLTVAALDATNMTVSFTAPASGAVLIRLSAFCKAPSTAVAPVWGLTDHTTTTILYGVQLYVMSTTAPGAYSAVQRITGLTPGTAYQMDWALASNTAASMVTTYAKGITGTTATATTTAGPAVMEVWAA
jgi:hypothetical protein